MCVVHSHSVGHLQHDNAPCGKSHIIIECVKKIILIFHFLLPYWAFFDEMEIVVHKKIVPLFDAM